MSQTTYPMTSHRPYLLRALVEWINDNDLTPHLLVDATVAGVQVPPSAVQDGRVILNIAERAVARLYIDNQSVSFSARFGGVSHSVSVPVAAVLAVYARENGQGMALPDDLFAGDDEEVALAPEQVDELPSSSSPAAVAPQLASVPDTGSARDHDDDDVPPPTSPEPGKRPFLRVVK